MTDFNAKHRELYLEELKEVLKDFTNGKYGGKEEIFIEKTFNLINKFNLNDKDEVITILITLKDNLPHTDFTVMCKYKFGDHSNRSLINNVCKHFEDNLIDIILESRYMRWTIKLKKI